MENIYILNLRPEIHIHLPVLTNSQKSAIAPPPHGSSESSHLLTDLDDLVVDQNLGPGRYRPQVGDVEGPRDAQVVPEVGAADEHDGHGGAEVEQGRGAAAVEVLQLVAVLRLDSV